MGVVASTFLTGCQRDLNSLRRVADGLNWARPKVYLHEATIRMMTGAAPAKTQQLLDKSLIQKSSARGLICVKMIKRWWWQAKESMQLPCIWPASTCLTSCWRHQENA